jgi:gas vesicle protein
MLKYLPLYLLTKNNNIMAKSGTLLAILAGAAIGAGIGILFAPMEGAETRRRIKEGYGAKKDALKDKFGDLKETVKNKIGMSKEDLETGFDNLVSRVSDKKDDIISTLERKLDALKGAAEKAANGEGDANTNKQEDTARA